MKYTDAKHLAFISPKGAKRLTPFISFIYSQNTQKNVLFRLFNKNTKPLARNLLFKKSNQGTKTALEPKLFRIFVSIKTKKTNSIT